ncbi:MAG: glycerol-3-phosphate acyltransferase [Dehalococcoidales bacterium]|nr:glycerol-3-phosphate acyltransferase [Dehalococcoidales bacterium]
MTLEFILLLIGAYLLGSIHAGYMLPKWFYGIDIREHGTGKIGASNVMRVTSKWMAIPVTIFDIGKGALAVWIAQLMELGAATQITIGIAVVIGHNWPIFLNFKGGRGIFTTLGVIIPLSPWTGLILLFITYIFAPVKQVAFGVFLGLLSMPFLSWFLYETLGIGIEDRLPITLGFGALTLLALLRRVITPRTALSQSVPALELFFNRLFFDRDIRDSKVWINRKSGDRD